MAVCAFKTTSRFEQKIKSPVHDSSPAQEQEADTVSFKEKFAREHVDKIVDANK